MKKLIAIILAAVMCLSLLPVMAFADTAFRADFETMSPGSTQNGFTTHTSANGWTTESCRVVVAGTDAPEAALGDSAAVVINGKTSAVGSLYSPTLEGGIKSLSFNYANFWSEQNGVDVTITVKPASGSELTHNFKVAAGSVQTDTAYSYTWTLEAPVSGNYTITFTNNSPSQSTSNKDRVAIWNLTWVPMSTNVHVCDNEITYPQKDAEGHTKVIACKDSTCGKSSTTTEKHSFNAAGVCACGWEKVLVAPTNPKEVVDHAFAGDLDLSKEYTLTGVITEIKTPYDAGYKNITVLMDVQGTSETKNISCYRLSGDDLDAVAALAVGDTITVTGKLNNYYGKVEFAQGCKLVSVNQGADEPVTPPVVDTTVPPTTQAPAVPQLPAISNPVAGTPYKFGMFQGNLNETYYLAGGMDGYYMATTTDKSAAIDVYLEATTGGYYFYTIVGGTKTYINMIVSGTHVNGAYEATASTVYTFNAQSQTLVATVDGAEYWFATRNDKNYTTMGPCKVEYEGFYGKFYESDSAPEAPVETTKPAGTPTETTKPAETKPAEGADEAGKIVDSAYELEVGAKLPEEATLTGKITKINTEYSEQYKNITVTIAVKGREDKPIMCFRLKGDEAAGLAVGDTITVTGTLMNYNGTIEFDAGCVVSAVVKNNVPPTGDSSIIAPVALLMALSCTGLAVLTLGKKKFF